MDWGEQNKEKGQTKLSSGERKASSPQQEHEYGVHNFIIYDTGIHLKAPFICFKVFSVWYFLLYEMFYVT